MTILRKVSQHFRTSRHQDVEATGQLIHRDYSIKDNVKLHAATMMCTAHRKSAGSLCCGYTYNIQASDAIVILPVRPHHGMQVQRSPRLCFQFRARLNVVLYQMMVRVFDRMLTIHQPLAKGL